MTDTKSGKRAIDLWLALGIALAALFLRLWYVNFPTDSHPDEPIIASLCQRFVEQGILSADWAGFETQWWSHSTYQFSPYTLAQCLIAKVVAWTSSSPPSLDRYILVARVTSCGWGSLAVFLVFLLGRICFSPGAALLGEATLATCFLHFQDSIYARVDAFLGCLVLLSLILAFQAAKRPGSFYWLAATSLSMGVVIAAKYNAFPVLVLIPFILFRWERAGAVPRHRAVWLMIVSLAIVGAGFIAATPEVIWRPGPLLAGLQYEFNHYSSGHIPHQAHDWRDNNIIYWTQYLTWLGLGVLPTLFALLFLVRIVKFRRWEDFMMGTFLAISGLLFLATKVRFERNLEVCLGPLALVAGVTAWDCIGWMKSRQKAGVACTLGIAFGVLWFAQPLRVIYNFRETVNYKREWRAKLEAVLKDDPAGVIPMTDPNQPSEALIKGYQQMFLADFGDLYSADAQMRCKLFFHADPTYIIASPWNKHNYPFSTVNIYHGPLRTFVYIYGKRTNAVESAKPK
jgi:hypothetical protein